MVTLVPMTEPEYLAYVEQVIPAYAADKVASGQWLPSEALERSKRSLEELLPRGLDTPEHLLFTMVDGERAAVGMLWIAAVERAGRRVAYVYDVSVQPAHRRKGHAASAFAALEDKVRELGLAGIALHVFGHNKGAAALYAKLGYQATNINMFKPVDPPAEAVLPREFAGGRLRRLRPADLAAFQAYRALPELGRYQGWSPMDDAEALAFLSEMDAAPLFAPGLWVQLGIAEAASDGLVGDVGVHLSDDGLTGEVGFTLAPASQGRGIATAAVRQALQLLAARTQVVQVLGITDSRNAASIRLLERLGFEQREQRQLVFRGEPCCEWVYALRVKDVQA